MSTLHLSVFCILTYFCSEQCDQIWPKFQHFGKKILVFGNFWRICVLYKMGQSRPLFVYFRHFLITISLLQIEKSVDGVLGIPTRGLMMVGADNTTELWQPPLKDLFSVLSKSGIDFGQFYCDWANVLCCKWPNMEHAIYPAGRTASEVFPTLLLGWNFECIWQFFELLFSIVWLNFDPTLVFCYRANFHCSQWPNIEEIIYPSGLTGLWPSEEFPYLTLLISNFR